MTKLEKKFTVAWWVMLVGYVDLLVLFTAKTLIFPLGGREPNPVIWLIHVVPLLVFIPGIIKRKPRWYVGLCFVLLVYFISSGGNTFEPVVSTYDWLTVILCVITYISGMMAARWQGKLVRPEEAKINE
ncbi:MAG: DUF2069 domain-containing protein [Pseudomonadales bacterium]